MTALILALLGLGGLGLAGWLCYQAGRCDERVSHVRDIVEAHDDAQRIRDRLRRDAVYAGRVRARFTR